MTLLVLLRDRHESACRDSKGRNCREGEGKLQGKEEVASLKLQATRYKPHHDRLKLIACSLP
ncbi:hypothetical protein K5D34_13000, partial [Pseudomonas cichorii]|nr:hypothetical protein [Pseudomonas cichorii]